VNQPSWLALQHQKTKAESLMTSHLTRQPSPALACQVNLSKTAGDLIGGITKQLFGGLDFPTACFVI
jgi:hypothetical protein